MQSGETKNLNPGDRMEQNHGIEFNLEKQAQALAVFLAQVIRDGVTYNLQSDGEFVRVTMTGGF